MSTYSHGFNRLLVYEWIQKWTWSINLGFNQSEKEMAPRWNQIRYLGGSDAWSSPRTFFSFFLVPMKEIRVSVWVRAFVACLSLFGCCSLFGFTPLTPSRPLYMCAVHLEGGCCICPLHLSLLVLTISGFHWMWPSCLATVPVYACVRVLLLIIADLKMHPLTWMAITAKHWTIF